MEIPAELTIGERVARARITRGISQNALAGLIGRSPGWVSQVERGVLSLDRKSIVLQLADVLGVDATMLEGRSPAPLVPGKPGRALTISELRLALMRWATPAISRPSPIEPRHGVGQHGVDQLRERVRMAGQLRQDGRFSDLAVSLPALLDDLRETSDVVEAANDHNAVHGLAAEAMHHACAMTKKLGHLDLAWMSAELAGLRARHTDDRLLVAANAWNHLEVYKAANAPGPARALALATLDDLAEGLDAASPGQLSLWGTLHLQAALIASFWNNRQAVTDHLREADDAARRLGGDANHYETMFGPTNVAIHRVAIAVELGDARAAVELGERIDASGLGRERQARLAIDLARAYEQSRNHDKALNYLLAAEKLAPDYVRPHVLVREIVGVQLRRAKPELRLLAKRTGIM
ncbi:MAG TPA: helix-turn-helix transcriptional regulator [Pseudonocardiaceae bacterium]